MGNDSSSRCSCENCTSISPSPWGRAFILFDDDYEDSSDRWSGRAEKSEAAKSRERGALNKFNSVRVRLQNSFLNYQLRIIELGSKPESPSPFKLIPEVAVDHIFEYLGKKKPTVAGAAQAEEDKDYATTQTYRRRKNKDIPEVVELDFSPGNKIVIPLTKPNWHLTGPCWRDFSRAVRTYEGWDVKRKEATPEEKKKFKEYRQGKVYFINAVYTVPGTPPKKKRAAKKTITSSGPAKKAKKTQNDDNSQKEAAPTSPPNKKRPAKTLASGSAKKTKKTQKIQKAKKTNKTK